MCFVVILYRQMNLEARHPIQGRLVVVLISSLQSSFFFSYKKNLNLRILSQRTFKSQSLMIIVHDSFSAYLPGEMKLNVGIPYSKDVLSTYSGDEPPAGQLTQIIVILLRLHVDIFFSPTTKALTWRCSFNWIGPSIKGHPFLSDVWSYWWIIYLSLPHESLIQLWCFSCFFFRFEFPLKGFGGIGCLLESDVFHTYRPLGGNESLRGSPNCLGGCMNINRIPTLRFCSLYCRPYMHIYIYIF